LYEKQIEVLKKGTSSLQPLAATNPYEELAKTLSDLNLKEVEVENLGKLIFVQNDELKILREKLSDRDKLISQYQKVKAKLQEDIEQLQGNLVGKPYLIGEKHLIWDHIITKVTNMWDSFKLIGEESTLENEADKSIQQDFEELSNKPQLENKIIKFLNSKSRDELRNHGVKDHTSMVMETKNFFTKRNLIQQAQNKCIVVKRNVEFFTNKFDNLVQMGLPICWGKKGNLLSFESYRKKLFKARENVDKFQDMTRAIRGQTIVDSLIDDFYLLWKIKKLFSTVPTYEKYTKLDISYRKMMSYKYPSNEDWKVLIQLVQE
jgi:hypothetical protein